MRIEDYVKENREVINDLRIASALLEKRRPIIAESLMDLAERLDDLAESEDERIRKEIVAAVEMRGDLTQGRKSEIYAYLEKQKEQKPAEWSEEDDAYRIEAVKLLENPSLYESCPNLRQETIEWLKQLPKVSVNSEWIKRKMMEGAVEGEVEEVSFNNGEQHNTIRFSFNEDSLHVENRIWFPRCGNDGDKVKLIIVKED